MSWVLAAYLLVLACCGWLFIRAERRCERRWQESQARSAVADPQVPSPTDMSDAEIWRALAIDYPNQPRSTR